MKETARSWKQAVRSPIDGLCDDEAGLNTVEYTLILFVAALAIMFIADLFGANIWGSFKEKVTDLLAKTFG